MWLIWKVLVQRHLELKWEDNIPCQVVIQQDDINGRYLQPSLFETTHPGILGKEKGLVQITCSQIRQKKEMPTLNLFTNLPVDAVVASDILKDATKAVSKIIGKPESVKSLPFPSSCHRFVDVFGMNINCSMKILNEIVNFINMVLVACILNYIFTLFFGFIFFSMWWFCWTGQCLWHLRARKNRQPTEN